ncbi:MAG TPA: hypothetical protein VGM50_10605 [Gemmatimonadaceae bacterium]
MLFRSKSPDDGQLTQLTQQDVADRRTRRIFVSNLAVAGIVAIGVGWSIRHGHSMPAYLDALTWGAMFACIAFCAGYQLRELRRGRGSRGFLRALTLFATMTAIEFIAQFFDGNVKMGLTIGGAALGIGTAFLMGRVLQEQREKIAD